MIDLRVLGGLELRRNGASADDLLAQPKHIALLVYLASTTLRLEQQAKFVRRDVLLGMFWPEQTEDRGRGALRQMLYVLKKELGRELLVTRGTEEIGVKREAICFDADEFAGAIQAGDLRQAARLYCGPFLDGFFLKGSLAFDQWMEAERERLARAWGDVLESLALNATKGGDTAQALEWYRRLADHNPYSPDTALQYMEVLVGSGDSAGAIQCADRFARRVREDLQAEPAPKVMAIAKQLRQAPSGNDLAPTHHSSAYLGSRAVDTHHNAPTKARRPRWLKSVLIGTAVALSVVGTAYIGGLFRSGIEGAGERPGASSSRFAVFPARVTGPDTLDLALAFSELLYLALDGAGDLSGVDPNALIPSVTDYSPVIAPATARSIGQRFGAALYVLSNVVRVGEGLSIRTSLYDYRHDAPLVNATASGSVPELAGLAEQIAWALVSQHPVGSVDSNDIAIPQPRNYEAFKAFLVGTTAMRTRGYQAAAEAFRRAVTVDSTFGLAWYRLSVAQGWLSAPGADSAINQAMRHREAIPEPERTLVEAHHAFLVGDLETTDSLTATLVSRYPTHVNAWHQRGTMLSFYNWRRGQPVHAAGAPLQQALEIDPEHLPSIWTSMLIAANAGELPVADSLARKWMTLSPHSFWSRVLPVFAALQDSSAFSAFVEQAYTMPESAISFAAGFAANLARDINRASALTALLTDSLTRPPNIQATGHLRLAHFAIAMGQWGAASAAFERAERLAGGAAFAMRAFLTLTAPFDVPRSDVEALRAGLRERSDIGTPILGAPFSLPDELEPQYRSYLLGLLHARLGEDSAALHYANEIDGARAPDSAGMLHDFALEIRALAAMTRGDLTTALAATERFAFNERWAHLWFPSVFHARSFGRYLRAEVLYRFDRLEDALHWFESIEYNLGVVAHFAPAHLRRAQIFDRLGDVDNAIVQYRAFGGIWQRGDAHLQDTVAFARGRIAALEANR